jgi:hypothetical protein
MTILLKLPADRKPKPLFVPSHRTFLNLCYPLIKGKAARIRWRRLLVTNHYMTTFAL